MRDSSAQLRVVDGDSTTKSIDFRTKEDLIGRQAGEVTQRTIPHFEDATGDSTNWGSLKNILKSLAKV